MRLTLYTDYALRVLIYVTARPERPSSISEMATTYGISHNHLMKVVHNLRKKGFLSSTRGRLGGVSLARDPAAISVGQVVRAMEDGFQLVDCPNCLIASACGLTGLLGRATAAFLAVLDSATLAELHESPSALAALFGRQAGPPQR